MSRNIIKDILFPSKTGKNRKSIKGKGIETLLGNQNLFFRASLSIEIIYTVLNALIKQLNNPED
jgi:hypothetical protein